MSLLPRFLAAFAVVAALSDVSSTNAIYNENALSNSNQFYIGAKDNVEKQIVKVTTLYEALCGGCRNLITNVYKPLYPLLRKWVDFEFIPYGHAKPNGTGGYICQHGDKECQLNQVETCALHYVKDPDARFNFIVCVESQQENASVSFVLHTCYAQTQLSSADQALISGCWNSPEGVHLEAAMAAITDKVKPPVVPWVLIGRMDVHRPNQDQSRRISERALSATVFLRELCDSLRGKSRPAACLSI